MADKRIQIGVGKLKLSLLGVTKADISEENDTDVVKTFDDPVVSPSSDAGFTIDLSMLEARSVKDYKTLKKILKQMKSEKGTLSMYETIKHKSTTFEEEQHYSGVSLKSNKVSYSAENLSARDVSFSAETMREIVAGEEIK